MKIAVTVTENHLEAKVDPRFGRCPYFLVVDTDTMEFEAVENPNVALGGGAGIQSAQLMAEKGVKFVLTGNCGPNAHRTLSAAGIDIIIGCSGVAKDTVEQFKAGQLSAAEAPNVASHFGIIGTPDPSQAAPMPPQQSPMTGGGMGVGRGGGRGMGRGGGRGMGMGAGFQGTGAAGPQQPPADTGKENELAMLKQQAEEMMQGVRQIEERIRQLEQEG
ncbi:MAG: NifB/NifX family molybdenum-iron cluster-binding protein [Deltaproteobacteria bacterium]|nr:NifB/NifX family molybdenum-iron cluster-binding protein [Deltaproteobacteria bacterium]